MITKLSYHNLTLYVKKVYLRKDNQTRYIIRLKTSRIEKISADVTTLNLNSKISKIPYRKTLIMFLSSAFLFITSNYYINYLCLISPLFIIL